jgi:predicted nucleic acid-binding protein
MRRRTFVAAALASIPVIAHAQTSAPPVAPAVTTTPVHAEPIDPDTPLEFAFVAGLSDERMRPIFRRYLLDTSVVLALAEGADAAPREVQVRDGFIAGAIFTSTTRMDAVLGADAPRIILNGRAALERLRGKNAVINYRLVPMLTLDDEDVAAYLATEGSASAGPTQ